MKKAKAKCGCVYEVGDRERWLELCPKHEAEFQETHQRWAQDHQQRRDNDATETRRSRP